VNGRILVVGDSPTVRIDLSQALEAAGLRSRACDSIAAARSLLATVPFDVIIVDVMLPDGDGVSLLEEIRGSAKMARTAVLMLSSAADLGHPLRGLERGADEYVGKPYDKTLVVAKVQKLLQRAATEPAAPTTSILVIDASATFRHELRRALERTGHVVFEAVNGDDGLRAAATHRPDAVVVDGMMPGMDGPSVVRRIRLDAALRGIPCLLLTGSDGSRTELSALDAGADSFVQKGEDLSIVLTRLGALLRQTGLAQPAEKAKSLLSPRRILVVGQEQAALRSVGADLGGEGYDIVMATSAADVLDLLGAQPVDCILLDAMSPAGDTGLELCARLKGTPLLRDIPVVAIAKQEGAHTTIEALASGADDFIPRGTDVAILRARVRSQLRRKQIEDENRHIRETVLAREIEATKAQASRELAETRAKLIQELERKDKELETFSYSASHDLRAPLRGIDGFSQALLEDYGDRLDDRAKEYLQRVRRGAQRMGELIEDMLQLFRMGRIEMTPGPIDLTRLARQVGDDVALSQPGRAVTLEVDEGMTAVGDGSLIRIVLENLLGNAWKFSSKMEQAHVHVGLAPGEPGRPFFVSDNGAGFDMRYADKLFHPFQRLHTMTEFPGTGIGLATVQKVIERSGGRVWAESVLGKGATFYFTLPRAPERP
jgi:DNA-binding response OmpR family regulator